MCVKNLFLNRSHGDMIPIFYKNIKFEMGAFLEKPLEWAIFIRPSRGCTDLSQIVISGTGIHPNVH